MTKPDRFDRAPRDKGNTRDRLHEAGLREIRVEPREYHFTMSIDDYLDGREATATGRFLREMVGEGTWERFRARVREVFRDRFPERFNDFRDVVMAVGTKPR